MSIAGHRLGVAVWFRDLKLFFKQIPTDLFAELIKLVIELCRAIHIPDMI